MIIGHFCLMYHRIAAHIYPISTGYMSYLQHLYILSPASISPVLSAYMRCNCLIISIKKTACGGWRKITDNHLKTNKVKQ